MNARPLALLHKFNIRILVDALRAFGLPVEYLLHLDTLAVLLDDENAGELYILIDLDNPLLAVFGHQSELPQLPPESQLLKLLSQLEVSKLDELPQLDEP
ncbi:MAG TPA: hypothetical protein VFA39_15500 [Steroidobacteraceae bacterium]|nr:hypothetical protein [Steroidobacteraceae bacterium]